uniref:CCHC-type domain-containing protein n=1 Tax=Globodera rostochiensis TaxID=31243 RepID=A0A914HRG8_GLORO
MASSQEELSKMTVVHLRKKLKAGTCQSVPTAMVSHIIITIWVAVVVIVVRVLACSNCNAPGCISRECLQGRGAGAGGVQNQRRTSPQSPIPMEMENRGRARASRAASKQKLAYAVDPAVEPPQTTTNATMAVAQHILVKLEKHPLFQQLMVKLGIGGIMEHGAIAFSAEATDSTNKGS